MTLAAPPLASAERERLIALASAIDAARRRYAPRLRDARHAALADRALDLASLADATRAVADVLLRHGGLSPSEAAAILGRAYLASDLPAVIAWAAGRSVSPPFAEAPVVWSALRLALPVFVGTSEAGDVTAEGECPACGMPPDLALLLPNGSRRLVCGACDTEWRCDRIRCPFCGNGQQDRMAYLVGGAHGHVIRVCDACGTYLKTIDRRTLQGDETPLLLRLLTAEMDLAAERAGYAPAAPRPRGS